VSATAVFLFDTTHHVLWAEELAADAAIPADVVPAPADRDEARCDLALETFAARADDLAELLRQEGVVFYPAGEDAEAQPG
jgi:hypothetical protein